MRKIIRILGESLDGFIEGPNREIDWHLVDDEVHTHFNDLLRGMGGFLMGRVTYELMAGFWPTADTDPESTQPMLEFARIWRDMPRIVYSRTLEQADRNTTIVREVVPEEVMELKRQPGGDTADTYFRRTECIAGVQDMRFQELMPDVFHWLGIRRIDRWVSMSNDKRDALEAQGIQVIEQIALPDRLVPFDAAVEMAAKKAAGYFAPSGAPDRAELRRTKGRALDQ